MEFNNTYITHETQRYEIYWTSQYAQHVLENFPYPTHGVDHTTIRASSSGPATLSRRWEKVAAGRTFTFA